MRAQTYHFYLFCKVTINSGISPLSHKNSWPGMLCYVIGSRRLVPPDALQPKAYCTNPGLQSFLVAPPGVSTRDPSSERRNYLGEKWPVIWTESCDFHATLSSSFTCRKYATWDKRLYFPSEGRRAKDFFALKNPTASSGFEPANSGTKG